MKNPSRYLSLRELATCGHDDDLWRWIDVATPEQFKMLMLDTCGQHMGMDEKRMHMLFVCEETE